MEDYLKKSLKKIGIINPIITSGNYIVDGRKRAEIAEKENIKYDVININEDNPELIRLNLLLSTKESYFEHLFEIADIVGKMYKSSKRQGLRTDLKNLERIDSLEVLSINLGLSKRTISRLVALTQLGRLGRQAVLNQGMSIKVAVQISTLTQVQQDIIVELINNGCNLSETTAIKLKDSLNQGLRYTKIKDAIDFLSARVKGFKSMPEVFAKYKMYRYSEKEQIQIVDEALATYFRKEMFKGF